MSIKNDLLSWQVTNPSNLQDHLPQPYRLIDQVLQQTILYQLQLNMHHIEQKKKDPNYEGKVQQYVAQSLIDFQSDICCLSSASKFQNYLFAGDRKGNLLVIDVAKKSLFCKKQLSPGQRITYITETTFFDNQTYLNISAVISNNSPIIRILRSKHNDPKVFLACQVKTTQQQTDLSKYPYECTLEDQGRLLIVKTYDGSLLAFSLPQIHLNQQKIKQQFTYNQTLSNTSNHIKKATVYPLQSALIDKNHGIVNSKLFQINFQGFQKPLKYKDILSRLKNKSKPIQNTQNSEPSKKDSKKQGKKPEVPVTQVHKQSQKQIQKNLKVGKRETKLWNQKDVTQIYQNPKYEPFYYILYEQVECPKKREFEKGRSIKMASKIIYGWTNTKQTYQVDLLVAKKPKYQNIPYYQQFLHSQILLSSEEISKLQQSYKNSFSSTISQKSTCLCSKTIYSITCSSISESDRIHLAFGLQNGTIAVYSSQNLTLQYTTQKHSSPVRKVQFFQNGWKLISGSDNGQVFIHSIFEEKSEMKKTHLFEPKQKIPIIDIKVNNEIGICYVIDKKGNVRMYDLWRNQKISRVAPCNIFSVAEGKGKKWVSVGQSTSTIYTNRDYSLLLSIDWPNLPISKAQQVSEQLIEKTKQLEKNPWKSLQINLHVIRNFQFLLDHFDGLQTIYKKGYEKSKILNLFTNLQYTQLYDRNFDIPDFGKTVTMNQGNNSTFKSNLSPASKFKNSNKKGFNNSKNSPSKRQGTSKTSSPSKQTSNGQTRNVKLTTEVLHPQKFLFERRKVTLKSILNSNEKLIETIREQHKKKERRANILQDELNRTAGGI